MRKFINITACITILLALIIEVTLIYWYVYPYKTIEWKTDKFPVKEKVIKRGDNLVFISDYCKYIDLPATVTRSFINDFAYVATPTITYAKKGCNKMAVVVKVPKELPSGKYYIHNKFTYKVNPIRSITLVHDSEEFIVK